MKTLGGRAAPLFALWLLTVQAAGCGGGDSSASSGTGGNGGSGLCTAFGNPPAQTHPDEQAVSTLPDCAGAGAELLGGAGDAWSDSDGNSRYACVWYPSAMSGKLPLVVWFHPSSSSAERLATNTSLLKGNYNNTAQFGPGQTGFIVLAPQGRYTSHYYPGDQVAATGWDVWYRQTGPDQILNGTLYRTNVDFAATDHFIDELVAAGRVDASRIYSMGWSAGASMSYLYGLNRSRIAGVAAYTAVDPLATFNDPCKQTPTATAPASISELQLSNPRVPIYHLHNTCDLWAECPNMLRLNQRLGGIAADKLISGGFKKQVQEPDGVCDAACGTNPDGDPNNRNGVVEHDRWPGDWVTDMLDFLAQQQTSN